MSAYSIKVGDIWPLHRHGGGDVIVVLMKMRAKERERLT